jgi:PAS domain S-box-containing protein
VEPLPLSSWSHHTLVHAARRLAGLCALAVAAIGAVTLLGWVFGVSGLSRLAPTSVAMMPNTAIALVLLGLALAANALPPRSRRLALAARAGGWAATLLIAFVASQWILGVDLGIDEFLFADPAGGAEPGRSAPVACIAVLLLGIALELDRRRALDGRVVNAVGGLPLLVGLIGLTGYLSGITSFSGLGGALRIAPATAAALVLAGVALLLARPQRSIVRLLVSAGPGGIVARRLLPVAVGLPLLLEVLRLELVDHEVLSGRVGDWMFAFLILAILAAIVLRLGRGLDLLDIGRRAAEERLRRSEALARSVTESANDAIVSADENGWITLFNPGAERLFGWAAAEVLGRPVTLLMPERYRDGHRAGMARVAAGEAMALSGATLELHGLTKGGREFDLELSLARLHQGAGLSVTAIMRDISPRKLLEDLTRQENDRMARVVGAQTAIAAGSGALVSTMELVAEQAAAIVGAAGAVVELPDGDDMVYRAVAGSAAPHLGVRVPIAGSLSGMALSTGATLHCTDSETDTRVDRDACRRLGVRSMICVPLHHDDTVGVLKVFSDAAHGFGERDERALELLGGLAGSTVHRAQVERRLAAHHAAAGALAGARSLARGRSRRRPAGHRRAARLEPRRRVVDRGRRIDRVRRDVAPPRAGRRAIPRAVRPARGARRAGPADGRARDRLVGVAGACAPRAGQLAGSAPRRGRRGLRRAHAGRRADRQPRADPRRGRARLPRPAHARLRHAGADRRRRDPDRAVRPAPPRR